MLLASSAFAATTVVLGAQAATPHYDRAKALFEDLRYAEALEQLQLARRLERPTREREIDILWMTAQCQVAEGLRNSAENTFTEMPALDPSWRPAAGTSPKVVDAYSAAKSRIRPADSTQQAMPSAAVPGAPAKVDATQETKSTKPWLIATGAAALGAAAGAALVQAQAHRTANASKGELWSDERRTTFAKAQAQQQTATWLLVGAGVSALTFGLVLVW